MREHTVCFTGHRDIPVSQYDAIKERLSRKVEALIDQGYRYFGTGGALGFDTLAAQIVLKVKQDHPKVKLILVLPCITQAEYWKEPDRLIYEEIKEQADKVVYTSQEYNRECMFKRNRHLVDCSSVCVCYLARRKGGTAYTVSYAQKQGLQIINVAEK